MACDVDIDFPDRDSILSLMKHIPASLEDGKKHTVGVYFHQTPINPFNGYSSINYKQAEKLNYFKIDCLNVNGYGLDSVSSPAELDELINKTPNWKLLYNPDVMEVLFQLNGDLAPKVINKIKPKSVTDLVVTIALLRPGKKYLINESRDVIDENIWLPTEEYYFKKSHAYSYALAIVVQLNILQRNIDAMGD